MGPLRGGVWRLFSDIYMYAITSIYYTKGEFPMPIYQNTTFLVNVTATLPKSQKLTLVL